MSSNRREFLRLGGATLVSTCLSGICLSSCGKSWGLSKTPFAPDGSFRKDDNCLVIDLTQTPELNKAGGSVQLAIYDPDSGTEIKLILVHPEDETYLAFSNVCTHRGKKLEYVHQQRILQCLSGHSKFDLNGRVLEGNASKPLTVYAAELEGNILRVYL